MVNLDIFDYLYEPESTEGHATFGGPILIAGNLSKNKSGYVYELPSDVHFELYGANFTESDRKRENIQYKGKVKPDELPVVLKGSFGLVWDGPSAKTCTGVYGEYLKVNNPHKTSLYLAAGIPVVVWNESAMADFIKKNKCGITINSIMELGNIINRMSEKEYASYKKNAINIGKSIRHGEYTKKALLNI